MCYKLKKKNHSNNLETSWGMKWERVGSSFQVNHFLKFCVYLRGEERKRLFAHAVRALELSSGTGVGLCHGSKTWESCWALNDWWLLLTSVSSFSKSAESSAHVVLVYETLPGVSGWDIAGSLLKCCLEHSCGLGSHSSFSGAISAAMLQWEKVMQRIWAFSDWSLLTEIFSIFLCMEIPSPWQISHKKNTLHIHLLTLIDNLHSKIWRWHWATTPNGFWRANPPNWGHPWLFIQEGSKLCCTTLAVLRKLGTRLRWQAQTLTDSVHGLDWMGSSGSKGLAQKSRICNRVMPCPSPDVRQREHVPVLDGVGDLPYMFAPFLLFLCTSGCMSKGKRTARRLVFALQSSVSKANQ